jgi:hypothetical protein
MKSAIAGTKKARQEHPDGLDDNTIAGFKPAAPLGHAGNPDRIGSSRGSNRPCGF